MNRFFAMITAVSLCACLAACVKAPPSQAPSEPEAPSPMPEVESMIEPIEVSEASGPSSAPEASSVPEPDAAVQSAPISGPSEPESRTAAPAAVPAPEPAAPASSAPELLPSVSADKSLDCEKIERELLRLINEERAAVGAEPLGIEENMLFAARIRAGEAIASFSHTRPNGSPYNTAFDEAGFSYAGKWHGENLASLRFTIGMHDENSAALEMFNGLKSSPGHYRNMVSDKFLQTGVGVAVAFGPTDIDIASAQLFSSL